ncbi:MAG: hypothetical protein ACRCZF_16575 [Gemmataceae bacterium]
MHTNKTACQRWLILGIVLTIVGVVADQTGLAAATGTDVWNYPRFEKDLVRLAEERKKIDAEEQSVLLRMNVKDELVHDLLDDRRTLDDVAQQFHELQSYSPYTLALMVELYGTDDLREIHARNVLDFIVMQNFSSTSKRRSVLARIAQQFRERHPGTRLPAAFEAAQASAQQ